MGAKKKGASKKTAPAAEEEEDLSVSKFIFNYKKNCDKLGIEKNKTILQMYETDFLDDGIPLRKFHLWDEMGWQGVRAIMDAFMTVNYNHCNSIRLWKAKAQDEGCRSICQYAIKKKTVTVLELLECEITALGCEFLGKCLEPKNGNLVILKLDHNTFGSLGIQNISEGLSTNKDLKMLSVAYCGIEESGARAIFEFLIFSHSSLEDVNLTGNALGNKGIVTVFQGLAINKSLLKVALADNKWDDNEQVMEKLHDSFVKNKKLSSYDLRHNNISDEGILSIIDTLTEATHVHEITVSEWLSEEIAEKFLAALAVNKPRKGKKKGKKKK